MLNDERVFYVQGSEQFHSSSNSYISDQTGLTVVLNTKVKFSCVTIALSNATFFSTFCETLVTSGDECLSLNTQSRRWLFCVFKKITVSCCYAVTGRSRWNIKKQEKKTGHSTSSHSHCLLPVEGRGRCCWRLREATLDISECSLGLIFLSQPDSQASCSAFLCPKLKRDWLRQCTAFWVCVAQVLLPW